MKKIIGQFKVCRIHSNKFLIEISLQWKKFLSSMRKKTNKIFEKIVKLLKKFNIKN